MANHMVRLALTDAQWRALKALAKDDERPVATYLRRRLVSLGVIPGEPLADQSSTNGEPVNGQTQYTDLVKEKRRLEFVASEAKQETRRVREKGRALEDGYAWSEAGGYATDSKGKRIALRDDDEWEYVEI